MQQAQADKIDNWGWYQAKKTRDEMMNVPITGLTVQAASLPTAARSPFERELARVRAELVKKKDDQKDYDALNYRDDQFDLSDSALALSISLLAVTALTKKRTRFAFALLPMAVGVLMGLAGLFGWHIHSDLLAKWLGLTVARTARPRLLDLFRNLQRRRAELLVRPVAVDHVHPDREVRLHELLAQVGERPMGQRTGREEHQVKVRPSPRATGHPAPERDDAQVRNVRVEHLTHDRPLPGRDREATHGTAPKKR